MTLIQILLLLLFSAARLDIAVSEMSALTSMSAQTRNLRTNAMLMQLVSILLAHTRANVKVDSVVADMIAT